MSAMGDSRCLPAKADRQFCGFKLQWDKPDEVPHMNEYRLIYASIITCSQFYGSLQTFIKAQLHDRTPLTV